MGLLGLRPWKPRTVGFLGIVASAMNCYMLFPAISYPAKPIKSTMAALKSFETGEEAAAAKPELKTA